MVEVDEKVEVLPYDVRWPTWFAEDAGELGRALGGNVRAIEHFGSTAVPNLVAKPIVDILVAVEPWPLRGSDRAALETLGYEYLGEAGVPGREYLRRRAAHATNLAVVAVGSPLWADNLCFRDYLRACPEVARMYGAAKLAAVAEGALGLLDYSRAKSSLVTELLQQAQRFRDGSEPPPASTTRRA